MGVHADAMRNGVAFPPTVGELAEILSDWRPRQMNAGELDLPGCASWSLVPWTGTKDCMGHLDLTGDFAWRFRRVFGYLCSIEETNGDNTDTSYRLEVLVKIPYTAIGHSATDPMSHLFATIRTYSSCAMIVNSDALILGDPIVGFVGTNFSGHGLAQFEAWKKVDTLEWGRTSTETMPKGNFEERDLSWAMRLTDNRR